MSNLKQGLIKLGTTNPELRPHIRQLLAGCEKLPEGGMRDNCEKKKEEGAKAKKKASFVNRLPAQYDMLAEKVIGALNRNSRDNEKNRNLTFGFVVHLLDMLAPEQAILVDRLLAKARHAPAEAMDDVGHSHSHHWDYDDPQDSQEDTPDIRDTAPMEYYTERGY